MMTIQLLLLLFIALITSSAHGQAISGFSLYDASSEEALQPIISGGTVDLALYQDTPLTVQVLVDDPNATIRFMQMDWNDGQTMRTDSGPPFFLGGDRQGDANAVNSLTTTGMYTLEASALDATFQELDAAAIEFAVVNSSQVTTPTATPVSASDVPSYGSSNKGTINGELRKWHKITIGFQGILTSETNNIQNPFTDIRLDVTFRHAATNTTYGAVPGFYACDGDAANTGRSSGNVWLVHFRPDQEGVWTYAAAYRVGPLVAVDTTNNNAARGVSGAYLDGAVGEFTVLASDKVHPDLRAKGRLNYVGEHHLKFQNGGYFLKAGADSPENFLAYTGFDNTPNYGNRIKTWEPHLGDYAEGDPTWMGGKGRGIIGAVNYLSNSGMNAMSFLTMNIQGDDENVFPYLSDEKDDFDRFDCSKTAQWDIVLDHAESKGLFLHFKTQEQENDQLLDSGELGTLRKLYYRELIANTNTNAQRKSFIDYFAAVDPYNSPIVAHTFPNEQDEIYEALLGYEHFTGVSLQEDPSKGYERTLKWVQESNIASQKWVVAYDEQNPWQLGVAPDETDPRHDNIRKNVLWANLMAGGAGVEYYFGWESADADITSENLRSRQNMWDQSRAALSFFEIHVPFWRMQSFNNIIVVEDDVSSDIWCLADIKQLSTIVIYVPSGGTASIQLPEGFEFSVQWFDPLDGGAVQTGSLDRLLTSGAPQSIGTSPSKPEQDWTALLKCTECDSIDLTSIAVEPKEPIQEKPIEESPFEGKDDFSSTCRIRFSIVATILLSFLCVLLA